MQTTQFDITYNWIYNDYQKRTDDELIYYWKHHQYSYKGKDDYDWIAFTVCEDLLRQRGNTYLDDNYPRD